MRILIGDEDFELALDGEDNAAGATSRIVRRMVEKLGHALRMPVRVAVAEGPEKDMARGGRAMHHSEVDEGEPADLAHTVRELRGDLDGLHARVEELQDSVARITRLLQQIADDADDTDDEADDDDNRDGDRNEEDGDDEG